MYRLFFSLVVALCLYARLTVAALTSGEIANSLNELAQRGFATKNLVLEINSTADAGPVWVRESFRSFRSRMRAHDTIQAIYTEMDTMVTVVLTDVKFMTNTPIIIDQAEEQNVYEGYSNVG
jgi:hypothetical protein